MYQRWQCIMAHCLCINTLVVVVCMCAWFTLCI